MGLKIEGLPDPMNRRRRKPGGFGHRTQAPVRCVPRRRLKGLANDLGDLVVADLARRTGTGLVVETFHAMLREPPPPFAYGIGRSAHSQADVLVLHAFRREQRDARPLGQPLRGPAPRRQALKLAPLARRQINPNSRLAHHRNPPQINQRKESHVFIDQDTRADRLWVEPWPVIASEAKQSTNCREPFAPWIASSLRSSQ